MTLPPTADDVWRWLIGCTLCGHIHDERHVPNAHNARTYRHVDGHPYLTRADISLGVLRQLHNEWQREQRR